MASSEPVVLPPTPTPAPSLARVKGVRRRALWRWTRRFFGVALAMIAALLVSVLTIDLGRIDLLRQEAERQATKFLKRPMHIGGLSIGLLPGKFVLRDVTIEGTPDSRPFFTVKRIEINVSWTTLIHNRLIVDAHLSDWEMAVETFAGNRSNIPPHLTPDGGGKPSRIKTTVQLIEADRGKFIYEDHVTPWTVIAPNLNFELARAENLQQYVGKAHFDGGTIAIQKFQPMDVAFTTRFVLDGSIVRLTHIDLLTSGAESHVSGVLDFKRWPEQTYNVNSRIDFGRMREIFFPDQTNWDVSGEGAFAGVFHLYKGGRELTGDFSSDATDVNGLHFADLHGSLVWDPVKFAVTHADADLYGGRTRFTYGVESPSPGEPSLQRFDADYQDIDLPALNQILDLRGIQLLGRARGSVRMAWPSGHFDSGKIGNGMTVLTPPAGVVVAPEELPAIVQSPRPMTAAELQIAERFGPQPVGGVLTYHFGAEGLAFDDSWVTTRATYMSFRGPLNRTRVDMPFHVTSLDWQESDRLLARLLTAFSGPTDPIPVGGYGTFDGAVTQSMDNPRIAGRFAGQGIHAWNVTWGRAEGDIVVHDRYVDVTGGVIGDRPAEAAVRADGRFSLGSARKDGGEEINAKVSVTNWAIADLRHAFDLDDWPMDGTMVAANLNLHGLYSSLLGDGTMRIEHGQAWKESFESATGNLTFTGKGMDIDGIRMAKSTGTVTGSAQLRWSDRTYAFDATGRRIPVESLDRFRIEQAPLTGILNFEARGSSSFDTPTYHVTGEVDYLFAGDQGIGHIGGELTVADNAINFERFDVTSNLLQVIGSGKIGLDDNYTSTLTLTFVNSSLDPYLNAFKSFPYTKLQVSGKMNVAGPLADWEHLRAETTITNSSLTLFDYELHNDSPIVLSYDQDAVKIGRLELVGQGTRLALTGGLSIANQTVDIGATGTASLEILKGYRDLTGSGQATLGAQVKGPWSSPVFSGFADVEDGSFRYYAMPRSLEHINGRIAFDGTSINLDGLHASMGEGVIAFGGDVRLDGFAIREFGLTAKGSKMNVRFPEGFTSVVDASLSLTGPVTEPLLAGRVDLIRAEYIGRVESSNALLGLMGGGLAGAAEPPPPVETGYPLRFNIDIAAPPNTIRIDNPAVDAHIFGSGNLSYTGTFDRPVLRGRIEIDRGEMFFNGNRYKIRDGSLDFDDPVRNDNPYVDVMAEVSPHASTQTFNVSVHLTGTPYGGFRFTMSSDPWLSDQQIVLLLLGESPDVGTSAREERALQSPQQLQEQMLQVFGARLLTAPITGRVESVVERATLLDSVLVSPTLGTELNPSAKLTLGKRISSKVFLTYSRTLSTSATDDVVLIEYEQSDRVSWILSRNEDRSYALDFRIRHVF